MNAMIYIRGNRADYDGWRDAHGATGWGYDDVLPYFIRSEGNTRLSEPFHGQDGPLHVEDRRFTHELTEMWVDSAVTSGLKPTDDFNGAEQEGAGLYQVTCKKGRRWSVAKGYLEPALERPNLTVLTGAFATRVVIEGGRAVGVAYVREGREHVARAGAEVVLSGGAVNSPQLLMLSGVGPADHVREHGIDVVAHLEGVGQNLHDHPAVPLVWHTKDTTDVAEFNTLKNVLLAKAGRGPLTSNVGEGGAFWRTRDDLEAPDMQVHVAPAGFWDNGLHEPTTRKVTTAATLVSVASRGQLRLRSADPRWQPDIDPAYYDDQADLDTVVAGLQRMLEIASTGPFARHLAAPFLPAMGTPSTEDLVELVRSHTQTLYHPVGTCAMGSGERAVVDPELRVRGVDGLRVADASVMPEVTRGNTNAPSVMIGEKAADLLRGRTASRASTATIRPSHAKDAR
jgi:choline dehydrogenase